MKRAVTVVVLAGMGGALAGCAGGGDTDDEEPSDEGADDRSDAQHAPEGVVQVLMPDDIEVELEPLAGAVGTETLRLTLVGTSQDVPEIGRGQAARQPAEGQEFFVVELETQTIEISDTVSRPEQNEMTDRGKATFSVQVGDSEPKEVDLETPSYSPLPIDLDDPPQGPGTEDSDASQSRLLVVSAPERAESVDLVVASTDLEQRLSLLTGEPGPDNIQVLARETRELSGPIAPQEVSATITEFGLTGTTTESIGIAAASLQRSTEFSDVQFAEPDRAFLQVMVDLGGFNLTLTTELRLPDGTVVQPVPLSEDDATLADTAPTVSYDVPADFTTGTLVFGKDYSWEVPTGGTISADFAGTVEFPIEIPLTPTS